MSISSLSPEVMACLGVAEKATSRLAPSTGGSGVRSTDVMPMPPPAPLHGLKSCAEAVDMAKVVISALFMVRSA